MLLLHYFNLSHFQVNDHFYPHMRNFLYGETAFYVADTINMMFYIWVLFSAQQFHFNFTLVSGTQYVIHFFDNLAIIVMRLHSLLGFTDDFDIGSNVVFNGAMTFSVYCIVAAMCSLPFSILERCFATRYLKDYEANSRAYISYALVFLLNFIGIIGAILLQNKNNTIFVVAFLMILNLFALLTNQFLRTWNLKKYEECHSNVSIRFQRGGKYSLAKRFQISENIKSLHMLNFIILYMGFMNVCLVISVLFSSFDISPERQAICSLALDASIFFYSFAIPQIMTCFCHKWKVQTNTFRIRIGCLRTGKVNLEPLRDTFGGDMRGSVSMNRYFDQLQDSWENA
ncbi:Serpentine receptor class epsilon-12 [Caenorhabditis elegans]|uniref:Serpentine receptor class epsilon-12 n=1 Tax=Caenorhabditis elegans TaxID=6239 RepID=SRE12_CAEEL|nr:Serpentine receptor class epsilon-12 [Caenorhabditis elegans]O61898.1 RecName: Full=Serpentine receptor class epsilon-12; Short=Protein sre-12 [Caenorhabditis elegans]CCD66562.1 Serpentine receptor class epsilon-12 [Caenorhabditis elegans]|eukprot:NP_504764.1 Serpentine receptor class epsilon-12 [Caenorhabditis elegans]